MGWGEFNTLQGVGGGVAYKYSHIDSGEGQKFIVRNGGRVMIWEGGGGIHKCYDYISHPMFTQHSNYTFTT